jgi:Crp-like helix-turn-helix domain
VKTSSREVGEKPGPGSVSSQDRSHQRLRTDDVHDPCQPSRRLLWKRFSEEVCRSHASLHRAERMLDCLDAGAWLVGLNQGAAAQPRADAHAPSSNISQEALAEMIGTTQSRVSHFMNKFRKLGLIDYNGTYRGSQFAVECDLA